MSPGDRSARISRSESLHQQVARNIRNDIAAGVLRDGQPLPSTRDLASQWGVSVFTINEAMRVLIDEGVVVSKARAGRFVHAPEQARRNEVRTTRPNVLMVGGYAGCGKSELGRMLARETGWPMLDKDTITRAVVEVALVALGLSANDRESQQYLTEIRPREYECLTNAMLENLQCGSSVIVTAPFVKEFHDEAWVNRTRATCADMNAHLTLVWVYCDAETMLTYIRHRGAARDASKIEDWPAYLTSLDLQFRPPGDHYLIDNSASGEPLQTQAKALLAAALEKVQ
ncbi:transcriptional regulator, GntR family [Pseudonocardia dioxanivorans CB1190]|uniref:Transcriptional regulator, GntR family n=1 Tax=Pseudonocardia dioxanivorans (strain ATCC 55486 / DSM 44775 / JCM 13855 / CB1190) TaxID=675635 RepID=F4CSH8_PSEUX|nr:GntR family transcriptional regulator [Pseudonocardia dioxanivorans]AEA23383.1 transcriptional regulator, GntR family [Pseudonocardia dioxanivorans CB1190]